MSNIGIAPLDPTSPIGQLRVLVGDTDSRPLDPAQPGLGDYAVFGDIALEASLLAADSSLNRAAGNLFLTLAAQLSAEGKSIRTEDLSINTTQRGQSLLDIAKAFLAAADDEALAEADSFVTVAPYGGRPGRSPLRPEATPRPLI